MVTIQIINDGTGTKEVGNYDYRVYINRELIDVGRVEGHKRRTGWQTLFARLSANAIQKGIEGELDRISKSITKKNFDRSCGS